MQRAYRRLVQGLHIESILELGSGTGLNSFMLAKSIGAKDIVLVDNNAKMLRKSENYYGKYFRNCDFQVRWIKEDVRRLRLDQKYDLVHSAGLLEHFPTADIWKILETYRHHMWKWGIVFVPIWEGGYPFWRRIGEILRIWPYHDEVPFTRYSLCLLLDHNEFDVKRFERAWPIYLTELGALFSIKS
jgi:SAM-dependent methyltransferase